MALSFVALSALAPSAAQAQDAVAKVVQLNKRAMESYDLLDFEPAKKVLLEALAAAKKGGIENHPVTARTYVHLGIVYINGLKDRFKGFQQFTKAIQIQPSITLDKSLSTAELKEVFESALEEARAKGLVPAAGSKPEVAAGKKGTPAGKAPPAPAPAAKPAPTKVAAKAKDEEPEEEEEPAKPAKKKGKGDPKEVVIEEPDLPARIEALDCPNPDEAPPEEDIALRCAVGPGVTVSSVILFYRPQGKEDFVAAPMVRSKKGWWNGVIPGDVVVGKSLHLYYEGRDGKGKAMVSNGRNDSPNLMLIVEGAKVVGSGATAILEASKSVLGAAGEGEEENPLDERENKGPRIQLGAKKKRGEEGYVREIGDRRFWVGMAVGSGVGFAASKTPLWGKCHDEDPTSNLRCGPESRQDLKDDFNPGLALAMAGHLAPEIGFYINDQLAIAVQGRNQYIQQPAYLGASVAHGAHMGLARVLYFNSTSAFRYYGSAMFGGGEGFRLTVHPDNEIATFKDTVRGGFLAVGAGFGMTYDFSPWVAVVAETNALIGMPLLSAVLDLNIGMQLGF